jgi:hypothetical protein
MFREKVHGYYSETYLSGIDGVTDGSTAHDTMTVDDDKGKCSINGGNWIDLKKQSTRWTGEKLISLPDRCEIRINGEHYPCRDKVAEISINDTGVFTIQVLAIGYETWEAGFRL